jgi:phosphatidate cytidylyltransferase
MCFRLVVDLKHGPTKSTLPSTAVRIANSVMLRQRLITGPILIAVLLGLTWFDTWATVQWGTPLGLMLIALPVVFAAVGGVEMTRLVEAAAGRPTGSIVAAPAAIGAAAMTTCVWLSVGSDQFDSGWLVAVPLFALVLSGLWRATGRTCDDALHWFGATLLATVWIGGGMGLLLAIYAKWGGPPNDGPATGAWMVLLVILVTKCADIGAYAAGRLFGRHKLIPWLSPGKTWEGLVGGVLFGAGVAIWLFQWRLHEAIDIEDTSTTLLWVAGFGVLLTLGGLLGDLSVSMLKRHAGFKDSGRLLPGMGGVLDVLDSLLFTGPLAWVLLQLLAH